MRRTAGEGGDEGFTLIELVLCIVIMGVITLPVANLVISGFSNYTTTATRFADSHDIQIATAYFSQDAANVGTRDYTTDAAVGTPQQSIWLPATGFPGSYCGKSVGTTLVLLKWDTVDATLSAGASSTNVSTDSAAYVVVSGTLHRVFCSGGIATTSDTLIAHNFVYPDSGNATPITCGTTSGAAASCVTASPPATISFALSIKGKGDTSVMRPVLTGDRRQQ